MTAVSIPPKLSSGLDEENAAPALTGQPVDWQKLRIGIVGTGNRGVECFARLLSTRDDAVVAAWCDSNALRMHEQSAYLGIKPMAYTDFDEMLDKASLDAVIVASPDFAHEEHAIPALHRGIPVLIDKPLATTVDGCRKIMDAAGDSTSFAMVGFNLRSHAVLVRLKELIDSGTLGRVFLIENREFYNGGRTYFARWNRFYEKSGGLWISKGCHDFDTFNWLLGFPKPVKVSSVAGMNVFLPDQLPFEPKAGVPVGPNCTRCAYRDDCPDAAPIDERIAAVWGEQAQSEDGYVKDECIYLSEKDTHDNGIAIVEYDNGTRASHIECFVTSLDDRLYTIAGDRGIAEVSLEQCRIVVRPRWSKEVITHQIPEAEGGHGGADPTLLDTFLRTVRGEVENTSTLEQAFWSTAIGQAAEISRRENRMVDIADFLETPRDK